MSRQFRQMQQPGSASPSTANRSTPPLIEFGPDKPDYQFLNTNYRCPFRVEFDGDIRTFETIDAMFAFLARSNQLPAVGSHEYRDYLKTAMTAQANQHPELKRRLIVFAQANAIFAGPIVAPDAFRCDGDDDDDEGEDILGGAWDEVAQECLRLDRVNQQRQRQTPSASQTSLPTSPASTSSRNSPRTRSGNPNSMGFHPLPPLGPQTPPPTNVSRRLSLSPNASSPAAATQMSNRERLRLATSIARFIEDGPYYSTYTANNELVFFWRQDGGLWVNFKAPGVDCFQFVMPDGAIHEVGKQQDEPASPWLDQLLATLLKTAQYAALYKTRNAARGNESSQQLAELADCMPNGKVFEVALSPTVPSVASNMVMKFSYNAEQQKFDYTITRRIAGQGGGDTDIRWVSVFLTGQMVEYFLPEQDDASSSHNGSTLMWSDENVAYSELAVRAQRKILALLQSEYLLYNRPLTAQKFAQYRALNDTEIKHLHDSAGNNNRVWLATGDQANADRIYIQQLDVDGKATKTIGFEANGTILEHCADGWESTALNLFETVLASASKTHTAARMPTREAADARLFEEVSDDHVHDSVDDELVGLLGDADDNAVVGQSQQQPPPAQQPPLRSQQRPTPLRRQRQQQRQQQARQSQQSQSQSQTQMPTQTSTSASVNAAPSSAPAVRSLSFAEMQAMMLSMQQQMQAMQAEQQQQQSPTAPAVAVTSPTQHQNGYLHSSSSSPGPVVRLSGASGLYHSPKPSPELSQERYNVAKRLITLRQIYIDNQQYLPHAASPTGQNHQIAEIQLPDNTGSFYFGFYHRPGTQDPSHTKFYVELVDHLRPNQCVKVIFSGTDLSSLHMWINDIDERSEDAGLNLYSHINAVLQGTMGNKNTPINKALASAIARRRQNHCASPAQQNGSLNLQPK